MAGFFSIQPLRSRLLTTVAVGALALVGLSGFTPGVGNGDVLVTPTRLVFEGRTRAGALSLINTGRSAATFRLSLVHQRMNEAGAFEPADPPKPGERFADQLIRFSPQQVRLEPGAAQVVRFQLRKPAELENGEYRSHLLLRAVPSDDAPAVAGDSSRKGLAVQLKVVYGITIPVIVRHGETQADLSLSGLSLATGTEPAVALMLNRTGTRSVYGDMVVSYQGREGAPVVVGEARGVAVYCPNDRRKVRLPLKLPKHLALKDGTLKVAFVDPTSESATPLAQAELPLP